MGLNYKDLFGMVVMFCRCCVLILAISLLKILSFLKVDYRCIIHDISKSDAIHLLEDSVLDDLGYTYSKMHIK